MRISMILLALMVAFGTATTTAQTPVATPITVHPSCVELPDYAENVIDGTFLLLPEDDRNLIFMVLEGDGDPTTMRPSTVRQLSEAFDQWAGMLEDVDLNDVPYAAQQYHENTIKHISLLSGVTNSIATGGALAMLAYTDEIEELGQSWDETRAAGRALCGNAWDRFQDRMPLEPMEPLERPLANADITFAEGQLVVLTEAMNPRPDPDTSDDPVARVAAGEEVTIVGGPQESDNFTWWEVLLADGTTSGWVVEDFIKTVD